MMLCSLMIDAAFIDLPCLAMLLPQAALPCSTHPPSTSTASTNATLARPLDLDQHALTADSFKINFGFAPEHHGDLDRNPRTIAYRSEGTVTVLRLP
ncbi:hypothetical protein [Nocardia nova]|uniref:hypothetical protein n=1 Tax=Nocardia nova TaxID=37330 RepID=UPI0033FA6910